MILISLIGALVQLTAFVFLPFLTYLIINKIVRGFITYSGIHKTTYSAMAIAAMTVYQILMFIMPGLPLAIWL